MKNAKLQQSIAELRITGAYNSEFKTKDYTAEDAAKCLKTFAVGYVFKINVENLLCVKGEWDSPTAKYFRIDFDCTTGIMAETFKKICIGFIKHGYLCYDD